MPSPTPPAPQAPIHTANAASRDRVDIRPTAVLLRSAVERHGVDGACRRFRLCRRRLGAIVAMRTTRGQHAHFLERGSVEDIVTHGPETFAVLHVPLAGPLQARLGDLLLEEGPTALAAMLGIELPRSERFVEQLTTARAGNGARVTHVCASIAERVGIDPTALEDLAIERAWCGTCVEHVLVAGDRRCPWCDTAAVLDERATTDGHLVAVPPHGLVA